MHMTSTREEQLLTDIRGLIDTSKRYVAKAINSSMTLLYWNIGRRIKEEILLDERAEYGQRVVALLAQKLSSEYGAGFTRSSLIRMINFYECFQKIEIGATVSHQLTWSHIIELLPLKDNSQREFYAFMAIEGNWSVRQLRSHIHKMTYERTLAAQKPINLSSLLSSNDSNILAPELVLKDPYVLDFLNLPEDHYEDDLEKAVLRELEKFILELRTGFSFVARQKRISIDGDHFYIDLLFYNRKLKRLVVVELKAGKFKPEYKGQMELYLKYLHKYECFPEELPPIGIILCTEKSAHQIELLDLTASGIHVAEYWTELPPKEIFERKIKEIVSRSREQLLEANNEDTAA